MTVICFVQHNEKNGSAMQTLCGSAHFKVEAPPAMFNSITIVMTVMEEEGVDIVYE